MQKIDSNEWTEKLAYIYWYETVTKNGWKLTSEQIGFYEQIKSEVMHYGYEYFETRRS